MKEIIKLFYSLVITFTCTQNYVRGNVFELQQNAGLLGTVNVTLNSAEEFRRFATINMSALPMEAIDPFGQDSYENKMLGYAAFFPNDISSPQQVYVAQKRQFTSIEEVTDYSIATSTEDFRRSTDVDHTERQLLGTILSAYNINADTGGSLCIYTASNPCQQRGQHNHNFHCIEYYNAVAEHFPNINFHIHFSARQMTINPNFIESNPGTRSTLLNQLDNIAMQQESSNLIRRRRVLQIRGANGSWYTILGSDNDYDSDKRYVDEQPIQPTIKEIASALNTSKNLSSAVKECLFNRIHNNGNRSNLFYHAI